MIVGGVRGERVNMIKAQSQRSNINIAFLKVEISSQNPKFLIMWLLMKDDSISSNHSGIR